MFNFRRLFYGAVPLTEPDSESQLLVSSDVQKITLTSAPSKPEAAKKAPGPPVAVKGLILSSIAAFIFYRHPITTFAAQAYNALAHCGQHEHQPIHITAKLWNAELIADRAGWKAECSSSKDTCAKAIDNDGTQSFWQSETKLGAVHWITIDLGREVTVHSLTVEPSLESWQDGEGGAPRKHLVEVRATATDPWQPVARGAWRDRIGVVTFEPRRARYVNLTIVDTHGVKGKDVGFVAISDISIWTLPIPGNLPAGGSWGETVDFPIVPVTAWLNPVSGRVVMVASYAWDDYAADRWRNTYLAEWDPVSGNITGQNLEAIDHDIFCPGTSMDENGTVLFTGGSTSDRYTKYYTDKGWEKQSDRIVQKRGYQGQTYLPDGRTFMIGGTWSGGGDDKNGEVYDGKAWTSLGTKIPASRIKMDPGQCDPKWQGRPGCENWDWQQHHPWLYAWKNDHVFHAGPSKKMNWFRLTKGSEEAKDGGVRADDSDAVGACVVMFDATTGSILTAGGAPNYHWWVRADDQKNNPAYRLPATNNAYSMTLGEPGQIVKPKKLASMKFARVFGNAAVLPNGEIFVVGGQLHGEPFYEDTWIATPEIYTPSTNKWRDAARHSIPRVYHSWAMLLPDATVLVGGSGLKREHDEANHYDAQIYRPSYLYSGDGKTLAKRPVILDNKISEHPLGSDIVIQTDVPVDLDGSLIRYSAATHALNNDLRRIPVKLVPQGDPAERRYVVKVPKEDYVALPGYWMLFVLKEGVPGVGKTGRIYRK
jgi:galactose oxidase